MAILTFANFGGSRISAHSQLSYKTVGLLHESKNSVDNVDAICCCKTVPIIPDYKVMQTTAK